MHPHLFGLVKSFGVLLALSFVLGFWLSVRRGRARGYEADLVLDFCLTVMISSVVGVRLFYVITHLSHFDPWYRIFFIWDGGLTLYGGIGLSTLTVWVMTRRRNIPFLVMADIFSPGVILGIGKAIGETAVIMYTAGSSLLLPHSIFDPVRTLPYHLYILASEGISGKMAYGTAVVLLGMVLAINLLAVAIQRRYESKEVK